MPKLLVSTPVLKFDAVASGASTLEKPIDVQCAGVTFPNGTVFDQTRLGTAGFYVYRRSAPASPIHLWDDATKEWKPDPGTAPADVQPQPFAFKADQPSPWQGMLIAMGQKDSANRSKFAPATNDYPQYFTRAFFATTVQGIASSGLSGPSTSVRFVRVADTMLAGVEVGDGEEPANATLIRMFLRYPEKRDIALVQLTRSGGNGQIEIATVDAGGTQKAVVRLLANGDIELKPAPGRRVVVSGELETETILYTPAGGGSKRLLV